MPRNVLVFADETGQAGGVRSDQRLSNSYEPYRAARTGRDGPVGPADQIAFYDAGLRRAHPRRMLVPDAARLRDRTRDH